jgi:hypothetical protein
VARRRLASHRVCLCCTWPNTHTFYTIIKERKCWLYSALRLLTKRSTESKRLVKTAVFSSRLKELQHRSR